MDRIQGTDGIRRDVRLQKDVALAGLNPWGAFVRANVITDEFLQGYAYAFVREWFGGADAEIVVGWDPRDAAGDFTAAVVRGVRKAGATAVVVGMVPTPAVPMYVVRRAAAAGLMVTASHNPASQNGVKIFLAPTGRKLLPDDDVRLTRAVMTADWAALPALSLSGKARDEHADALEVFTSFHLDERNAWLTTTTSPLADVILVVDPARGAYSGVAATLFEAFGAHVIEVNADAGDGRVNYRSGVADLEGIRSISRVDAAPGGRFREYPAIREMIALADANETALASAKISLAAAVFDADGDRFFLIVFDPTRGGEFVVLSGDEIAILQAAELARRRRTVTGGLFVNTVESDLGVQLAARALGFAPLLKPVGDKWILAEANRTARGYDDFAKIPFGVGCEETGHAITFGSLARPDGSSTPFAAGNGVKSALNTFAAISRLRRESGRDEFFRHLQAPFRRGYKTNNYVLYSNKPELLVGGMAYEIMNREIPAAITARAPSLRVQRVNFDEEPDLLYWAAYDGPDQALGIFCRNSGTEDKSVLYVRSDYERAAVAAALQEDLYPGFYALTKDVSDSRSQDVFALLRYGVLPGDADAKYLVTAVEKLANGGGLTARGLAVREACGRMGKL